MFRKCIPYFSMRKNVDTLSAVCGALARKFVGKMKSVTLMQEFGELMLLHQKNLMHTHSSSYYSYNLNFANKKQQYPLCKDCVNYRPRSGVDKGSAEYILLSKCAIFPSKCVGSDGSRYDYTEECRIDELKCGLKAKNFVENTKSMEF